MSSYEGLLIHSAYITGRVLNRTSPLEEIIKEMFTEKSCDGSCNDCKGDK